MIFYFYPSANVCDHPKEYIWNVCALCNLYKCSCEQWPDSHLPFTRFTVAQVSVSPVNLDPGTLQNWSEFDDKLMK